MSKQSYRAALACIALLTLLFNLPLSVLAQAQSSSAQEKKDKKKDDNKKDDNKSQDDKKATKQERRYQEIKQFSEERFRTNPEFRDEVNVAYRQMQREHSEYAFRINTRDADDEQVMRTGDKLKIEDTLYDNPMAQDYVNRVGQSLVPAGSNQLYAFKITLNPVPEARALSTGTVYVSSGLLSVVDNEAQLAYVLGHEIAHVEREHWHEDVLVEHGLDDYNEKQQQKRKLIGNITSIGLGVMTGGLSNSFSTGANVAFFAEAYVMPNILKLAVPNAVVSWDKAQEDEADRLGLEYMLKRNYDPREVPKFYASLQRASASDKRASLGFMANAVRITDRMQQVSSVIGGFGGSLQDKLLIGSINLNSQQQTEALVSSQTATGKQPDEGKTLDPTRDAAGRAATAERMVGGTLSDELKAKLEAGEIIGSTAEFEAVMAELKRDNGVRAYYYDMFRMARENLEESLRIRNNDPFAHFYYGKVLKLTARNASEKSRAMVEFRRAIDLDVRKVLPEARLNRALAMMENKDPSQMPEIVSSLKEYVNLYQRIHGGVLPPNMDVIYDYMQEAGEVAWSASPATNVSTKNIEPIGIMQGTAPRPTAVVSNESQTPAQSSQPPGGGGRRRKQ
jgi:predicted Zn-dependent protease